MGIIHAIVLCQIGRDYAGHILKFLIMGMFESIVLKITFIFKCVFNGAYDTILYNRI